MNQLNTQVWAQGLLGDIIVVERGSSPRPIINYVTNSNDGVNWVKIGDTKEGQKYVKATKEKITKEGALKSRYVAKGDFILSNSMSFGRPYIMDIDGYIHDGWFALRLPKQIDTDFFYNLLSSTYIKDQINSFAVGGVVKNISGDLVKKVSLPIPPIAEQKVIADKLDTLLAQVETIKARLDRIPQILKTFRQSVLVAAVSGKLTEEWRNTNHLSTNTIERIQESKKNWASQNANHNETARVLKRTKAFNSMTIDSHDLPNGWVWGKLEDCVLMIVDCHNKTAPYVEEGIPLIRTSNVRDGQFVWDKLKFINQETYEFWSKRCPPESGDIIFTREAPMGEAAIIPSDLKVGLGQRTMLIRPIEQYAPAKYLLLTIMDPLFKKRSEDIAVGTGVKHYRVGDVSNLLIPLPSIEEQAEIVHRVEELFSFADRIEQKANAALDRVNKLTQSILAKAFRGELTEQWRNANRELITGDNSAEALLARIKTERVGMQKQPRPKRVAG